MGTREYMTSSSAIHVSSGYSWIAILLDKPRYNLRNPLIAHAVIGSQEQHGCSKEHTP
jgi:hypothetical protein